MTPSRATETTANVELAKALDARHPRWDVIGEGVGQLASGKGRHPDVVIYPAGIGLLPLVIETEFAPAGSVEGDADGRLGDTLVRCGVEIDRVLAVRLPGDLRPLHGGELQRAVAAIDTRYEWCVRSRHQDTADVVRWPDAGWLTGNADELARFCELLLVDERGLERAADLIVREIDAVTADLRRDPLDLRKLQAAARVMGEYDIAAETLSGDAPSRDQENREVQVAKMAIMMLANAFVFELAIDDTYNPYSSHGKSPVSRETDTKSVVLSNWATILKYNYWPIFNIASQVLSECLRSYTASHKVIPRLVRLAENLSQYRVSATGDISGQLFGKLISDRKYLATFYTLPSSAYLMAELVVGKLDERGATPTGAGAKLDQFKFADLACGTGALLTSLYQRVTSRIRSAGNDDTNTHKTFMEDVIYAADIMPAAVHLTATLLSSTHPSSTFERTNIVRAPDRQDHASRLTGDPPSRDNVSLGSLELLDRDSIQDDLLSRAPPRRAGTAVTGTGPEIRSVYVRDRELDACVMNPPFTSNSSQGTMALKGLKNRKWAGLGRTKAEQEAMELREAHLVKARRSALRQSVKHGVLPAGVEAAYHGNVGLAAPFTDLADAKLKPGGVLGLILPQAFMSANRWKKARALVETLYDDIVVLTIAATGVTNQAFSADTGMAECMLIATKALQGSSGNRRVTYVSLSRRPDTRAEAVEMARALAGLSDTPQSAELRLGTESVCGTFRYGEALTGRCAGVADMRLVDIAEQIAQGELELPLLSRVSVPTTSLGGVGDGGPNIVRIGNAPGDEDALGPLVVHDRNNRRRDWAGFSYPILWKHDTQQETRLEVLPDGEGVEKAGRKDEADALWIEHASRLHFNRHFRLNSQALAACRTPQPTLGGGWPTVKLTNEEWEPAAVLWHNTTLGLITWWLIGSRQQLGRCIVPVSQLPDLPTLDYRQLTQAQHAKAAAIYARFTEGDSRLTLRPANEAYRDEARVLLDRAVLEELLGLNWNDLATPLQILRHQWCSEPSVFGSKRSTRPASGAEANDKRDDLRANLPRLPPPTVIGGNKPIVRPKMETRGR